MSKVGLIVPTLAEFVDQRVGAAYGRQLPHCDAGPIGVHT